MPTMMPRMPQVTAAVPTDLVACSDSSSALQAALNFSIALYPFVHFLNALFICLRSNTGEWMRLYASIRMPSRRSSEPHRFSSS